jgi:hypothetical protein
MRPSCSGSNNCTHPTTGADPTAGYPGTGTYPAFPDSTPSSIGNADCSTSQLR